MEHGAVGRVHLVGAVNAAGADDADGRLAGQHGAGLHGAGMGAQHDIVVHVEGILRVPGGMVLGQVHQLEVIVIQLHLGAFHHFEAQTGEAVDQLVHHQRDGMGAAHLHGAAGFGHVDGLRLQGGFPLQLLQGLLTLVHALGQPLTGLVDLRAHLGPLLRGQLAHALEQLGQGALFAQHFDAQRVQRGGVLHFGEVLFHLLPQFPQSICHCHDRVPPSIGSSGEMGWMD